MISDTVTSSITKEISCLSRSGSKCCKLCVCFFGSLLVYVTLMTVVFQMPFQGQAVPILVGVASWSFTSWQKQKYERKQQELNQITEQIRNFYGPLSGNRLVYNSSYVCVTQCKHVSMYEWLEAAQEIILNSFFALLPQFLPVFSYSNTV